VPRIMPWSVKSICRSESLIGKFPLAWLLGAKLLIANLRSVPEIVKQSQTDRNLPIAAIDTIDV
jgi:hypothetical protein